MTISTQEISVVQEGLMSLVQCKNLVNISALQSLAQPTSALHALCAPDMIERIFKISAKDKLDLNDKYRDPVLVNREKDLFVWELERVGIVKRVKGDIGRRADAAGRRSMKGEIDYRPGLWVHRDLAIPYAEWREGRESGKGKSPLLRFLEKHLKHPTPAVVEKPRPVAQGFAGEVDAEGLKDLEKVDRVLMADGVSAAERIEVLTARVEAMQGA